MKQISYMIKDSNEERYVEVEIDPHEYMARYHWTDLHNGQKFKSMETVIEHLYNLSGSLSDYEIVTVEMKVVKEVNAADLIKKINNEKRKEIIENVKAGNPIHREELEEVFEIIMEGDTKIIASGMIDGVTKNILFEDVYGMDTWIVKKLDVEL